MFSVISAISVIFVAWVNLPHRFLPQRALLKKKRYSRLGFEPLFECEPLEAPLPTDLDRGDLTALRPQPDGSGRYRKPARNYGR